MERSGKEQRESQKRLEGKTADNNLTEGRDKNIL